MNGTKWLKLFFTLLSRVTAASDKASFGHQAQDLITPPNSNVFKHLPVCNSHTFGKLYSSNNKDSIKFPNLIQVGGGIPTFLSDCGYFILKKMTTEGVREICFNFNIRIPKKATHNNLNFNTINNVIIASKIIFI